VAWAKELILQNCKNMVKRFVLQKRTKEAKGMNRMGGGNQIIGKRKGKRENRNGTGDESLRD